MLHNVTYGRRRRRCWWPLRWSSLDLPADALDDLFRRAAPRLSGEVGRTASLGCGWHAARRSAISRSTRGSTGRRCGSSRAAWSWVETLRLPAAPLPTPYVCLNCLTACADRHQLPAWPAVPVRRAAEMAHQRAAQRLEDIIDQLSVVGGPLNLTRLGRGYSCPPVTG